ncbi:hypothetical protein TNIN_410971 [Trichonephila inaurata madagascariensis]|uniref:Uncharacterized protein n=1 Tax=Trichonephila inaurata madagascariensis TaxID=2747483 RepID=A0A8X6MLV0_9ARAC|nr:hypothetical protein TNIN_410971 [Trichonephila inaurata madagascariensis]
MWPFSMSSISSLTNVSGCDHGFGYLLAKKLDSEGFHVYASCYCPSGPGATELKQKSSNRLKILGIDVTSDESVLKAVKFVEEDLKPLSIILHVDGFMRMILSLVYATMYH